jgi:starvation-inducible DNA-binding protein
MSKKTKSVAAMGATGEVNIGISTDDRATIARALSKVLADSYTLYLMTHNFHWNVTGPLFNTLHAMFMAQYTEQWTALDGIAERIRALGHHAPGTYRDYSELSSIKEPTDIPQALEMVRLLVKGNEAVATTARQAYAAADKGSDQPSADLLTRRMDIHEKNAWMLRSLLE